VSTNLDHQQLQELLGAYAVHATSEDERVAVASHLQSCDSCRDELDELRRAASLLGSAPALPSDDLWQNIQSKLSPPAAGTVRALQFEQPQQRPQQRPRMQWLAGIAAAVLLVAGIGVVTLNREGATSEREDIAMRAADAEGARTVMLQSQDQSMMAEVVMLPDGRGYILDTNLPTLSPEKTYQLWAVMGQNAISAGVLGTDPTFSPFMANGDVTAFAITEEVAGGVIASQQRPMLSGVVQTT
jgi:hypothetical protein